MHNASKAPLDVLCRFQSHAEAVLVIQCQLLSMAIQGLCTLPPPSHRSPPLSLPYHSPNSFQQSFPFPFVVPRIIGRRVRLESRILNGHPAEPVDALLLHGNAVQIALIPVPRPNGPPQLLAGVEHAGVQAVALLVEGLVLLAAEELPGAVDGPVAQVAKTGHAQGRRCGGEHVLLEDLDARVVFRPRELAFAAFGADIFGGCGPGTPRLGLLPFGRLPSEQ